MDYDVGAVRLTSPPVAAFLETYRPAVLVRNNGIHPADVSGTLRIYDRATGLLIESHNLTASNILPGLEKDASSSKYWTPPDLGDYLIQADVTSDRDQYDPNNHLPGVTVHVSSEPPPPPPVVPLHALQHEADATDQLNVDGLPGRLAEKQDATNHASAHESGGGDELDVTGLKGQLGEAQATAEHGNERHSQPFLSVAALSAHDLDNSAHALSSGLEHTSRRGLPDGYPGLDAGAKVPAVNLGGPDPTGSKFLRSDQSWQVGVAPPYGWPIQVQAMQSDAPGVSTNAAREDHRHQECGGFVCADEFRPIATPEYVLRAQFVPSLIGPPCYLRSTLFGVLATVNTGAPSIRLRYGCAASSGDFTSVWIDVTVPLPQDLVQQPFLITIDHCRTPESGDVAIARITVPGSTPIGAHLVQDVILAVNTVAIVVSNDHLLFELRVEHSGAGSYCLGSLVEHVRKWYPSP